MSASEGLIGRDVERRELERAADRARHGSGSLLLLSGEAGIGKTRLAREVAEGSGELVLWGSARQGRPVPYGPVVEALRSYVRERPDGLDECGPLKEHLALLMPELGTGAAHTDRATILEAIRSALAVVAAAEPGAILVLDDLHWSDDATLELVTEIAGPLDEMQMFAIGTFRSDELPREHSLRRVRGELRRAGTLHEIELGSLPSAETGELAAALLGAGPSPRLVESLHARTLGVPFFVREVVAAVDAAGLLRRADGEVDLSEDADVPVPETIREAVLMRTSHLSADGRAAAEAAAVAGESFDLDTVATLSSKAGIGELFDSGLLEDAEPGRAAFRHALAREALYTNVPWLRRRDMHRELAEALEAKDAPGTETAVHWQGAKQEQQARRALLRASEEFAAVHAYRDAGHAIRGALDLWDPADEVEDRVGALEHYANCTELAGELAEATRAWREVADVRQASGSTRQMADAQRRLASIYAIEGDRARAVEARRAAADGFAAEGAPAEAAADRLVAAGYLQRIGDHSEAQRLAQEAAAEAREAGRADLEAEADGLRGVALAKRGDVEAGLELARAGLSLALGNNMTAQAASLYQRLGTVLEAGASYREAADAIETAFDLCQAAGESETERVCLECISYLLRELGEWDRCVKLCRELSSDSETSPRERVVTDGVLGSIEAYRGSFDAARDRLTTCLETAVRIDLLSIQVDAAASLAWLEDAAEDHESAARHCEFVLQRWARSEDHHYSIRGLRMGAAYFAGRGDDQARAYCDALARISAESGRPHALAALADALGSTALAEGDPVVAAEQHERALDLHDGLDVPAERAMILLNAGVAKAAAGDRERALAHLAECHRVSRALGARPLAARAAEQVELLGEPLAEHLGKRAAAEAEGAGLTRRELEVMKLVGAGLTNKEIAEELVLSPRTVDMHVRNILTKFGCRSRVDATRRAEALGLLDEQSVTK